LPNGASFPFPWVLANVRGPDPERRRGPTCAFCFLGRWWLATLGLNIGAVFTRLARGAPPRQIPSVIRTNDQGRSVTGGLLMADLLTKALAIGAKIKPRRCLGELGL